MSVYYFTKDPGAIGGYVHHGPCELCGADVAHDGPREQDVPGHSPCLSLWADHDLTLGGSRVGTVRYGAMRGAVTWSYRCPTCDPDGLPGSIRPR